MKSTVSITQHEDISIAISGALDLLEGLPGLFEGRHVAIKPNDTWASKKDLTACTRADTVRAVIRYVKEYGPRTITVTGGSGAAETDDVFRLLGIDRVISEEGVEFVDHNRPPFKPVHLDYGPQNEVMVHEGILKYETIISLAQHKVHNAATVTLSMKNIAMSFPAADYYGHSREQYLHPHNFFKDLHGFIAGMCKRFPISLAIINGHPAMIGRGPIGGKSVETGLLIASRDFVAADSVGARMLGYGRVQHIEEAENLGLGVANLDNIEIAGIPFDEAMRIFREKCGK